MTSRLRSHSDYTVAWICPLPLEMAAAKLILDDIHDPLPQPPTDHNSYTLGTISGHNVVMACLPSGVYGTISASIVVAHLLSTFPSVQFGLMVGIGGGVPSTTADIRLGDIVVSKPTATNGGVVQYDYGKALSDGRFQLMGLLNKPPQVLLKAVSQLESEYIAGKALVSNIMADALRTAGNIRERFSRPQHDWLFQPTSYHHHGDDCSACEHTQLVSRPQRTTNDPYIHYGLIASGDQLMRDAKTRDTIAQDIGILCFEMEAAGVMDELPSLVIRGICDYCDSHKGKHWQGYAALAAAAYAKALLSVVPVKHHRTEVSEPGGQLYFDARPTLNLLPSPELGASSRFSTLVPLSPEPGDIITGDKAFDEELNVGMNEMRLLISTGQKEAASDKFYALLQKTMDRFPHDVKCSPDGVFGFDGLKLEKALDRFKAAIANREQIYGFMNPATMEMVVAFANFLLEVAQEDLSSQDIRLETIGDTLDKAAEYLGRALSAGFHRAVVKRLLPREDQDEVDFTDLYDVIIVGCARQPFLVAAFFRSQKYQRLCNEYYTAHALEELFKRGDVVKVIVG